VERRAFPYLKAARLWNNRHSIAEIGERIGYVDTGREDGDRFYTLLNHLRIIHKGYRRIDGSIVKPYRVSRTVVRAVNERHRL
jgi:hypothetical protein